MRWRTYSLSILTVIIQLELNDDSFVKVESRAFNFRCLVAQIYPPKLGKELSNLVWSDNGSILAFDVEDTFGVVSRFANLGRIKRKPYDEPWPFHNGKGGL